MDEITNNASSVNRRIFIFIGFPSIIRPNLSSANSRRKSLFAVIQCGRLTYNAYMKKFVLLTLFIAISLHTTMGQTNKDADPKDVSSLDAIMRSVYDVISGDKGKPRDWDRFRTLFYKDARMIPTSKNQTTGVVTASV